MTLSKRFTKPEIDRREFLKTGTALWVLGAGGTVFAKTTAGSQPRSVTYDERSVMIDGHRKLLSCGEMHYARSTRAMWPLLLERSKRLGLNTITTYVFWNIHETSRGVYDFSGDRDLGHFLDLCQQHGLDVFLRVGPYICAEWNFGGFPPYLRDEPGITIRTMNKPYTDRVEGWFERLSQVVNPRLASAGGPITLIQVENEYSNVSKRYGEAGQEYLRWIVDMAKRIGFANVPTTTCEGGAQGAIETANGFNIPPQRIEAIRKSHPGTPLLWTELYPAWYRVWGGRIAPARDVRSMAGGILDFVSRGGSGFNYYPWHGGSNFGRNSMYLQTPTYDFFAPLDEYGAITATGQYLGRFHAVLQEHSATLLEGDRTETMADGKRTTVWRNGKDELTLVQEQSPEHGTGPERAQRNMHARLTGANGQTLFDLDGMQQTIASSFHTAAWREVPQTQPATEWQVWEEPYPAKRSDPGQQSIEPLEQLSLTKDETDYCWYSTTLDVPSSGPQEIVIPYGGDFFYVYLDGQLVATSIVPLDENRGPITPDDPAHPRVVANISEVGHSEGFRHAFALPSVSRGKHSLDLLAVAVGMVKGDWQIASPMNFERKGIWEGVQWNGKPLQGWTMRVGLMGEKEAILTRKVWDASGPSIASRPLLWYKRTLSVPTAMLKGEAVFRLDAAGLGKGAMWVNGHAVGRHWLIDAQSPQNMQSQRQYHVPADWLRASNEIVILEEQMGSPAGVKLQVRV